MNQISTVTPVRRWALIAAILPIVLLMGRGALAEEELDPPDRVARVSYLQGDVSVVAGDSGERERAELNRPLTTGDDIDVADGGRAELQVDVASLHIGERSLVSLLALDDQTLALRLDDGEMVVHVRELRDGDRIEIETPNARVTLMEPGEYRLVAENGDSTVVGVRDGGAEIENGPQVYSLHASQEGRYTTGTSTSLLEEVRALGSRSDLEVWANKRESRDYEQSPSSRYVSREVIGYEDLDEYGSWESNSLYGSVWYPRHVSAGWAPYTFGRWAYIGPWGWTWIDQSPWGFAPFHYGRWAHHRNRWCWVPGPRHVRPVYAPALVGWKPRGSGYAWFPLGPREVYVPRHRASDRYVRQVNVSNTTIVNANHITNVYRNRTPPGRFMNEGAADHVKAIPRHTFTATRPAVRPVNRAVAAGQPRAVRPTYQRPTLQPSRDRDPPREWSSGGTSNAPSTPSAQVPRNTVNPRERREVVRSREIPRATIPSGTIPRGPIPTYTPAPRSTQAPPTRTTSPPPARSVTIPSTREPREPSRAATSAPTRSYAPPARVIERPPPRNASPPERRASPAPPPQQSSSASQRTRPDRRDRR